MTQPTGDAELDDAIDVTEAGSRALAELAVIGTAESTVAAARSADLLAQQTTALRRWRAAKGQLTKATRTGDPARIEAAAQRCAQAYAEYSRTFHAGFAEMVQISRARHEHLDAVFAQIKKFNAAGDAVLEILRTRSRSTM